MLRLPLSMGSDPSVHLHVPSDTARFETDGMVAGLVAGIVMLVTAMLGSAMTGGAMTTGQRVLAPLRYPASIIMREHAMEARAPAYVIVVMGLAVHVSASVLFGHLFGLISSDKPGLVHDDWPHDPVVSLLLGAMAGGLIWLVDIQLLARLFYPWMAVSAGTSLLFHVFAFGAPLGLTFMWLRHRRTRLGQEPTDYPKQGPVRRP